MRYNLLLLGLPLPPWFFLLILKQIKTFPRKKLSNAYITDLKCHLQLRLYKCVRVKLAQATIIHGCSRVESNLAGQVGSDRVTVTGPDPWEYEIS